MSINRPTSGLRADSKFTKSVSRLIKVKKLGAVYTPALLSNWAASLLHSAIPRGVKGVILDPACGDGALLYSAWKHTRRTIQGVDCDPAAIRSTKARLSHATLKIEDGLIHLADIAERGSKEPIAGFIANPPWGAELQSPIEKIRQRGYAMAFGQFDTWDLFVEGIIKAAPKGAAAVLILPDAIFLPEHRHIRSLLVKNTRILNIARLGEGFFPGVFRGTVVLAFRKEKTRKNSAVSCLRITPSQRDQILSGERLLRDISAAHSHSVPQSRFSKDEECRFDIDTKEGERSKIEIIEMGSFPWDKWTHSGRGLEISKTGRICRCPACNEPKAPSRKNTTQECIACGNVWDLIAGGEFKVIEKLKFPIPRGWSELIVGEDVDRHRCPPSRIIKMGVAGVDYKQESIFSQTKLLIRKTGVGIKAAVDESGARTNQVVFHFLSRPDAPIGILDYLQAVMCSRVMLAWHLKKQGDSEWRSHPYVTQKIIKTFPVTIPADGMRDPRALELIRLAKLIRRPDTDSESFMKMDMAIERHVAGIIGLTKRDFSWVLGVLDEAEGLEPIRTLRIADENLVFPSRAV